MPGTTGDVSLPLEKYFSRRRVWVGKERRGEEQRKERAGSRRKIR